MAQQCAAAELGRWGPLRNSPMKTLLTLLMLLAVTAGLAANDDAGWSKPVNGLRARLTVLPPEKKPPFCRVYIEFENVDDVIGQKRIRFNPAKLALRVSDKDGKELSLIHI